MSAPDRRRLPHSLPYPPIEHLPPRRTALPVRLWRWRTEILLGAGLAVLAVVTGGAAARGVPWPAAFAAGALLALVAARPSRDWLLARFWCVFTRHRMQRLFSELPLHTRRGRLPLVLWITPTATGERALVLCRAGVSAEAFALFTAEFEAACSAPTVRFAKHLRHPQLVTVETVRRPPRRYVTEPGVEALYGCHWIPLEPGLAEPYGGREAAELDPEQVVVPLPGRSPGGHG